MNTVMKIAWEQQPERLHNALVANSYMEKRKSGRLKLYDTSKRWIGCQCIENRAGKQLNEVKFDWMMDYTTPNGIRNELKDHLMMGKPGLR